MRSKEGTAEQDKASLEIFGKNTLTFKFQPIPKMQQQSLKQSIVTCLSLGYNDVILAQIKGSSNCAGGHAAWPLLHPRLMVPGP